MPVFSYLAKDLAGEYHRGEVDSADEYQVAKLLRKKKLIVISVKPLNLSANKWWDKVFNRVSFGDVVMFTRQLATMIDAGLILTEALDILGEQQINKRFKQVIGEVSGSIKGGVDFATALEKHPDVFPRLYAKLVKAGEASGKMDTILQELATNLEKEREFQSKVRGAMIYPIVIIIMMIGVMLVMIFFVMPKLLGLYTESGLDLPLPTKIMIGFSTFLFNFWWAVFGVILIIVISFRRFLATTHGRLIFDDAILKLPVIGRIINVVILTSFTRTFALLTASGLSILESIKIVADISGNAVYRNGLKLAYKGVERGLPFSTQLLSLDVFPRIVGQMVKTGEETGKLDDIMFKLADYYESESDHALKNITTLIEPIVIVLLGIGVAFLVISVILPIYQLTTNIR